MVLTDAHGSVLEQRAEPIGYATNNEAEYHALIRGLEIALQHGVEHLIWYSDSELLVRQWLGTYRVRRPRLARLMARARALAQKIPKLEVYHTPRERNQCADTLSKEGAKLAQKSISSVRKPS